MASFLENFRQFIKAKPVNDYPKGEEDTDAPSPEIWRNNTDWQNRVAMPFSYASGKNGKRSYGIIYLPDSSAREVSSVGRPNTDELEIYGADMMDGVSLTSAAVQDIFKKHRDSFRFESNVVPVEDSAMPTRDSQVPFDPRPRNPLPGVLVANAPALRRLRDNMINLQDMNARAFNGNSVPSQKDFIEYYRLTRRGKR